MAEARRLTQLGAAVEAAVVLPEGPLAVALSGGADSAALLWLCVRSGRTVRAIHIHHGLAASDKMEQAATAVAADLDIELNVVRVEIPAGASPEGQARAARYAALDRAHEAGEWVLTAHTSDDQAETVLDHLLRGSGLDGLAGIPALRSPFARPFLGVSRAQTRELATLAGLPWQDDPANDDPAPRRNQIRRRLLPQLEADYNPRLRQALTAMAAHTAADVGHLEALVASVPVLATPAGAEIAAGALVAAPPVLASRLARRLLAAAGTRSAPASAVEAVLDVAAGPQSSRLVSGGLTVRRRGPMVAAERSGEPEAPETRPLSVPGMTAFGAWIFEASVSDAGPVAAPLGAAWMVADAGKVGPLSIEPASLHPALAERLAATGILAPDRPSHPVVVGSNGPVWIPMVRRLAGDGWVDDSTERYLVVRTRVDRKCRKFRR